MSDATSDAADADLPRAVTVRGDTATLGSDVFVHEHVLFDLSSRLLPPATAELTTLRDEPIQLANLQKIRNNSRSSLVNLTAPPFDILAAELASFQAGRLPFASCTLVDASVTGRNLAGLVKLSESTGVNIIASAGLTGDDASARSDDPEGLVEALIDELQKGVPIGEGGGATVRCGMLTLGDGVYASARAREAILQAIGNAQMRTNAPVLMACTAEAPEAILAMARALVEQHGARAESLIVAHAQNLLGANAAAARATLEELLKLGVRLCFDSFGCTWDTAGACDASTYDPLLPPPTDEVVAHEMARLISMGYGPRLMASPGVASRLQLESYGGGGLRYLRDVFFRHLGRAGVSDEQARALCGGNAAAALCWWRAASKGVRLTRPWSCHVCHRYFEEAVNPAEELPTDQNYYEKFDHRYCTMACLSAHRKAGFKSGFTCPPPPEVS